MIYNMSISSSSLIFLDEKNPKLATGIMFDKLYLRTFILRNSTLFIDAVSIGNMQKYPFASDYGNKGIQREYIM